MATSTTRKRRASADDSEAKSAPKGRVAKMMEEEAKRQDAKRSSGFMPFRFWLTSPDSKKFKEGDDEAEIIILDESIDSGFVRYEHNLQLPDPNTGKSTWGNIRPSLKDSDLPCPISAKYGDPSLMLFLTVLVLKPYTTKSGEVIEQSRKLLPLTRGQYPAFAKLEELAMKKHGTMRGMLLFMKREPGGKTFRTGVPTLLDDGTMFDMLSEEDLIEDFGHEAMKNRDGKVYKQENEDLQPFNYREVFPPVDPEEIYKEFGHPDDPAGSRAESIVDSGDDLDMSAPAGSKRRSRRKTSDVEEEKPSSTRRRRRPVSDAEEADEVSEGDTEEVASDDAPDDVIWE